MRRILKGGPGRRNRDDGGIPQTRGLVGSDVQMAVVAHVAVDGISPV